MHFNFFDIILLAVAFGFVWGGWWSGLIQTIGGVVGLFVGEIIAGKYYDHFAGTIAPVFGGNVIVSKVFAFLLIFLLVTRLVGVVFWAVNKVFNLIAIVPGMKLVNRVGGAAFGFIEAALFIGISLQFLVRLPISSSLADFVHNSALANYALNITGWLVPLLPKVLKDSQNALDSVLPANVNVPTNVNVNDAKKAVDTYNTIKNTGLVK